MSHNENGTDPGTRELPAWVRRARLWAGFTAAAAMSLYLAVKIAWVVGALVGVVPDGFDAHVDEWILLNAVTVGMAIAGVVLGLALARPWGKRLPAPTVILPAWIASGFLVAMLPYAGFSALLAAAEDSPDVGAGQADWPFPAWEAALIAIGFAGMGLGLLIAAPIYMRERWPRAFTGTTGEALPPGGPRRTLLPFALATAAVPTALWAYWAAGGTAGLNPAALDLWGRDTRWFAGFSAAWAVLGAWSIWALYGPGCKRLRMRLPMAVGFVASGSLFAWGMWRTLWKLLPITDYEPLKAPPFAIVEDVTAMAAGLAMFALLLLAYRAPAATSIMDTPGRDSSPR